MKKDTEKVATFPSSIRHIRGSLVILGGGNASSF